MSHTPGPWREGKDNYGGIVADYPIEGGCLGTDDVEHYGGYLVAESVAPCNKPLIAAATELLKALRLALPILEEEQDCLERSYLPQPSPDEERALGSVRDAVRETRAAIAKATGGAA